MDQKVGKQPKLRTYYFRQWREQKGISQGQVARLMGMAPASLSRIESGQRPFTSDFLEDFCEIIGCSIEQPLLGPPTGPVENVQSRLPDDEFEALQQALGKRLAIGGRKVRKYVRKLLDNRGKGRPPGVKKKR